jgi:hypothetical protein
MNADQPFPEYPFMLLNPTFEHWQRGAGPYNNEAIGNYTADGWKVQGSALNMIQRTATHFHNSYALEAEDKDNAAVFYMEQELDWQERYQGRVLSFIGRAREGTTPGVNKASISIFDNVGETISKVLTTDATFQAIAVSHKVDAAANQLGVRLYPAGNTAADQGGTIFDWCILVDAHVRTMPIIQYDIDLDYYKIYRWYQVANNKQVSFEAPTLTPRKYYIPFSETMRGVPTVVLNLDGASVNAASIVASQVSRDGFVLEVTPTSVGYVLCQFDFTADASI